MESKHLDDWLKRCAYAEKCIVYSTQNHECVNSGQDCIIYSVYLNSVRNKELLLDRERTNQNIEYKIEGGPDGNWGREP